MLDCIWGFTQVGLDQASHELLTLTCRRGLLRPLVLYFGPKQGPSIFQGLMCTVFGGLRDEDGEEFCSAFIDDVNVSTVKAHTGETDESNHHAPPLRPCGRTLKRSPS